MELNIPRSRKLISGILGLLKNNWMSRPVVRDLEGKELLPGLI